MRVTFDSNAWQPVVVPHRFPKHPSPGAIESVHGAVRSGRLQGFISETVATLEAVPKLLRDRYLSERQLTLETVREHGGDGEVGFAVRVSGNPDHHPGLKPVLVDRLGEAFALGFRLLPSPRLGMPRPVEIDREDLRIPLTDRQRDNIWDHLQRISDISDSIEAKGVGRAMLEEIALCIQGRIGLPADGAWFDGLDKPSDPTQAREISEAFAEWADGDSVALHVAYGLDVFCTGDMGRSARRSILDRDHRAWLTDAYGVQFATLDELAKSLPL